MNTTENLLFENSPLAMIICETNSGHILNLNPVALQLFDYQRYTQLPKNISELFRGNETGSSKEMKNSGNITSRMNGEMQHIRHDGTIINLEVFSQSIVFENQESLLLTITDISRWKNSEKNLLHTKEQGITGKNLVEKHQVLENFFALSSDLFCIADYEGNLLKVNKTWEPLLGLPVEQIEGKNYAQYVHPDDREISIEALVQLEKGEEIINFVNRYRRPDGTYRNLEWNSKSMGSLIFSVARDISDQLIQEKKLETALKDLSEYNQLLQTIFDIIPVRLFWKDKTSRYLGCNKLFANDAGFDDPKSMIGLSDTELVWGKYALQYQKSDNEVLQSGESKLFYEDTQITPTGETMLVLESKIPFRNSQGEIIGIFGTYEDITLRKAAENRIRENEEFLASLILLLNDALAVSNTGEIMKLCVSQFVNLFKSDSCFITEWNTEKESVETIFSTEDFNPDKINLFLGSRKTLTESVMTDMQVLPVENTQDSQYVDPEIPASLHLNSLLGIPVFSNEEKIGAIIIGYKNQRSFAEQDIEHATLASKILSIIITRTQYLDRLQHQEKIFRSLIEDAPLGIMAVNRRAEYVLVNQAASDLLGYSREELLKMTIQDVIHTSYLEAGLEHFEKLKSGVPAIMEILLQKKNRINFWASLQGVKLSDDLYVAFHSDVTEKIESQKALVHEKALLTALLNSIPDLVFYKDLEGRYIGANPEFARYTGLKIDELTGKTDFELFDFNTASWFRGNDIKVLESKIPEIIEELVVYPDGTEAFLETLKAPFYNNEGKLIGILGLSRNINERIKFEKALKENDEMLKSISANIPGIILQLVYFPDGRIKIPYVSTGYKGYFPISLEEIREDAEKALQYILPEDLLTFKQSLAASFNTLENYEGDFRVRIENGRIVWMKAWGTPKKMDDGSVLWHGYLVDNTEKKLLEQKIVDSEKQLKEIFNSLEEVVWVTDLTSRKITFITPSVEKLYGYPQEAFITDNQLYFKRIHPDDIHQVKKFHDFSYPGEILESQYRIIRADGEIRWILNKMWQIHDALHNPIRMEGIIIDITAIKKLESDNIYISNLKQILLGMANNFINLPLDELNEAINRSLEQVGSFVGADRAYIFDYDFEHYTASNTFEWCAPGIKPEIENLQESPLDDLKLWIETHRKNAPMIITDVLSLDNEDPIRSLLEPQGIKSIIALPMFNLDELVGFIGFDSVKTKKEYERDEKELLQFLAGIIVNANNRIRFESALLESEERFRQLAENVNDIFWLRDTDTKRVLYQNPAFISFFRVKPEPEQVNLNCLIRATHEDDRQKVLDLLEDLTAVQPHEIEVRIYNANDTLHWFSMKVYPVKNTFGDIVRQVGIATDISGLKKAEVALKEALELEKKLGELKSNFVSMASHEFRTPLASVLMAADSLQRYRSRMTDVEMDKYLERIMRNVEFLRDIIGKVLNLSKIESGKIPFKPEKIGMRSFLTNWIEDYRLIRTVRHLLKFTPFIPEIEISIDTQLFKQAIENLVSNSIKYSAEGTVITISLHKTDDHLVISVADQGIGIPVTDFPYLFDPFFRSKIIENVHGTGLGLPIVKQIIELHNGRIYFESELHKGSAFYLELPLKTTENEQNSP
jgi:PAS domain S-box-containing protein